MIIPIFEKTEPFNVIRNSQIGEIEHCYENYEISMEIKWNEVIEDSRYNVPQGNVVKHGTHRPLLQTVGQIIKKSSVLNYL